MLHQKGFAILGLLLLLGFFPMETRVRTTPNFKLEDLDGKRFELSGALEEGPVLIDF